MAESDHNPGEPGAPPPVLLAAIEKLLRPLVRLMLAYQITFPQLSAMLKGIYVDVAEKEFQVDGRRQSDSRINLLTGVHRKDVKRLRAEIREQRPIPQNVSAGARVIGHWLGSREYVDTQGNPLPLPLKPDPPDGPGFDRLVEQVCRQDIRPRVILDEWLRLGVAHIENDCVVLNTGAFTPEKGFEEKAFYFGKNIQDHISAGTHNLMGGKPSYFDRSVYYDNLSADSVQQLAILADKLGMEALTRMNREALARQKQDRDAADARHRMNFGVFNYSTESRSKTESREDAEASKSQKQTPAD